MTHPPRHRPARPLLALATLAVLTPTVARGGSSLGFASDSTAGDPFAFTHHPETPAEASPRLANAPLLLNATPPPFAPLPGDAAAEDRLDPTLGTQVVPLPPALFPGLVLIGLAYLRTRRA